jgi:acid phosphatase (class A)
MRHRILALALVALTLRAQPARTFVYMKAEPAAIAELLPTPPAPQSRQTLAELDELHGIQEGRSPQEVALAKQDDSEVDVFAYRGVIGPGFTKEALPTLASFWKNLQNDSALILTASKTLFHRPRPYHADTSLRPVCRTSEDRANFSYPSGHATNGYLWGFVLALMVPEKREAIFARADEFARNRLVCGVHYPTDLSAGKQAASLMMGNLLADPRFRRDLEAARAELRGMLKLPARP